MKGMLQNTHRVIISFEFELKDDEIWCDWALIYKMAHSGGGAKMTLAEAFEHVKTVLKEEYNLQVDEDIDEDE